MSKSKMTAREVELAVANWLDVRKNIAVPNVSWGLNIHECDILSLSKRGYATEIEIKVSKSDLKADLEKRHHHHDNRIRYLYFAMPDYMRDCQDLVPSNAGVLLAYYNGFYFTCQNVRDAAINFDAQPFSECEQLKLARLGTLRVWALKRSLYELKNNGNGKLEDYSI